MDSFPAFIPLADKRVVIAGGDAAAEAKARLFAGSRAEVVRLAGPAAFEAAAYAGADLVFVASFDPAFRRLAAAAARSSGALVNVADAPELCDFLSPAIVDRGPLVAAIGSGGAAPALASLVRGELERVLSPGFGRLAGLLGERRRAIRAAFPDLVARRAFYRRVLAGEAAVAADRGDMERAAEEIDAAIAAPAERIGRLFLIEAPASADLLSLRAARVLGLADLIVTAPEADPLTDSHGRREAERWSAPAVDEAIVARVRAGEIVAELGPAPEAERSRRLSGMMTVVHLWAAPP